MNREPDCAWGLLIAGLLFCAAVFCAAMMGPTPEETSRMFDSIGKTTGVNWR